MIRPKSEHRTTKYLRLKRWRQKNGYQYKVGRGCSRDYIQWLVFKFIHENLNGPSGNLKSCINPSIMEAVRI